MTMTVRGSLVGADWVLDQLPKQAFAVKSWANGVAPATQDKIRHKLKECGRVIEPVFDAKRRRYVGLVYASPQERAYCFREWAAFCEGE